MPTYVADLSRIYEYTKLVKRAADEGLIDLEDYNDYDRNFRPQLGEEVCPLATLPHGKRPDEMCVICTTRNNDLFVIRDVGLTSTAPATIAALGFPNLNSVFPGKAIRDMFEAEACSFGLNLPLSHFAARLAETYLNTTKENPTMSKIYETQTLINGSLAKNHTPESLINVIQEAGNRIKALESASVGVDSTYIDSQIADISVQRDQVVAYLDSLGPKA